MATTEDVNKVFGVLMRANLRGAPSRAEPEVLAQTMQLFELRLQDIDTPTLKAAALAHIDGSEWFPTIHELRALAERIDDGFKWRNELALQEARENAQRRRLAAASEELAERKRLSS